MAYTAGIEDIGNERIAMAQLTVRKVDDQVVKALRKRAAEHGRSAESEHREILRAALMDSGASFADRAASLRKRLRSTADSADIIRADRDRDHAA